jgi:hypothetical protein
MSTSSGCNAGDEGWRASCQGVCPGGAIRAVSARWAVFGLFRISLGETVKVTVMAAEMLSVGAAWLDEIFGDDTYMHQTYRICLVNAAYGVLPRKVECRVSSSVRCKLGADDAISDVNDG